MIQPEFISLQMLKEMPPQILCMVPRWQSGHLTSGAIMRIWLVGLGAQSEGELVKITFPNGETRMLLPEPSEHISKLVVEDFAIRYLERPGVLWLSTSGKKVVATDLDLTRNWS